MEQTYFVGRQIKFKIGRFLSQGHLKNGIDLESIATIDKCCLEARVDYLNRNVFFVALFRELVEDRDARLDVELILSDIS